MKKLYLFLLFFTGITNAQIINIPDANFKNKLIALGIDTNSDGEIQNSEALLVQHLNVSNSNIVSLFGIQNFTNLLTLSCANNPVTNVDVHGFLNLNSLNVSGCSAMEDLNASNTALTQIDTSGLTSLLHLSLDTTSLTTLSVSNLPSLTHLSCGMSSLSSFSITSCPNITNLNIWFNQLSTVTFSDCPMLSVVNLSNNQLTTVDVSELTGLQNLGISSNPLVSIYAKNGANETIYFAQLSTLEYICADESQIATLQGQVLPINNPVEINSYCSFTPGGNFNTIAGNARLDSNANGCDASDNAFPFLRVMLDDGTNTGVAVTNGTGNYVFYTGVGNFTLTPVFENPSYFTATAVSNTVIFTNNNNNVSTQDFCIAANGIHKDLEISIAPIAPSRPGFDAIYALIYRNKGNQTLSGTITFGYNDTVLDFIVASANPDAQSTGSLSWNFTNLLPFESRSQYITLNVNGPMETPAVNIDDLLDFTASITPLTGDETTTDNAFAYQETVVGAFDPNNKICLEGAVVSPDKIGGYLHYVINFENTGTAAAEKVVVKDLIDTAKFDMATLQVVQTSHPAVTRVTGNKVEFLFDNIDLGPDEHGNVTFKIKTKNTLIAGNSVTNKADIFFDYNFPIETNPATTTFQALQNEEFALDASVSVYPNPSAGIVNIKSESILQSVQVFDAQGRAVQVSLANDSQLVLDVSAFHSGIYFIKVRTDKGTKTQKFIKH